MTRDWDLRGDELASEAIARGEPTGWFETLYAEGADGSINMPWDRAEAQPIFTEWSAARGLDGTGRTAVVVGCGLGADAEHLARLGFATSAFDIAPTAVAEARRRHPDSPVDYRVADLLDLPADWADGFDLVVEIFTLQALPDPPRTEAADGVRRLVADGGTLLAVFFRDDGSQPLDQGPPFAITRAFMEGMASGGLTLVALEEVQAPGGPRWRGEFRRWATDAVGAPP